MKERPILFSAPMVRAILDGTKTQTRRLVKPQPMMVTNHTIATWDGPSAALQQQLERMGRGFPYGQPGDRLWIREKFQPLLADGVEHWRADWETGKGYAISYPATDGIKEWIDADDNIGSGCKPSIHMPRWASRITLEITGVRVDRLQDISEADAIAEGCPIKNPDSFVRGHGAASASGWYSDLWQSINGPGSWDENPWVWVVEFKRLEQPA